MKKNHKTEINIDEMENKIRILIRHLHALHPFEDVFPLSIFMCLCDVCVCVFASLCVQEGTHVHMETKADVGNYSQSLFQFSGAGLLSRTQRLLVDATS